MTVSEPPVLPLARRIRYRLEAAGFFTLIGFFRLFGIERASNIGGWIGRNVGGLMGIARRARRNLAAAYPEKTEAERAAILNEMWDNLGRVLAEYAHLDKIHSTGEHPRIELIGDEHVRAAFASGKGVIMVSGHFANWEVMPFTVRDHGGVGGTMVRSANNPHVNLWLENVRTRNGLQELIPKGTAAAWSTVGLLRKGAIICMLIDQRASEGILVPFFGRDVQTTPAPAALALKMGCVVIPACNERIGPGRFRVRAYPPMEPAQTGDLERDIHAFTVELNRFIEERVRERPGQWLWIHKRWVDNAHLRKRAQTLSPGRGGASNATSKRV